MLGCVSRLVLDLGCMASQNAEIDPNGTLKVSHPGVSLGYTSTNDCEPPPVEAADLRHPVLIKNELGRSHGVGSATL
jgi:hypothetical protein